jgi:hypothetical protein
MTRPTPAPSPIVGELCRNGRPVFYFYDGRPDGDGVDPDAGTEFAGVYHEFPTRAEAEAAVRLLAGGRSCDECGAYVRDGYANDDGGAFCSLECAGIEQDEYDALHADDADAEPFLWWTQWEEPEGDDAEQDPAPPPAPTPPALIPQDCDPTFDRGGR